MKDFKQVLTLIEMLLVVAIIAIIAVISIPTVGTALENAGINTDKANERGAKGVAVANYMINGTIFDD